MQSADGAIVGAQNMLNFGLGFSSIFQLTQVIQYFKVQKITYIS